MHLIGKLLEPIMRPVFNVPGAGAFALTMGMSSGYPVGAKIANDLREEKLCTKTEAERLLAFCNTSGPLFIVGAVGVGMFGDVKIGLMLLSTHFLSAITVGLLFKKYKKEDSSPTIIAQKPIFANKKAFNIRDLGALMGEAIKNSVNTLLLICGYIVFFAVLGDIFEKTGIMNFFRIFVERFLELFDIPLKSSNGVIKGLLEVTSGIKELSSLNNIPFLKLLTLGAFVLGFGGFSVHMQTCSIIAGSDISMKPYLLGKLLHGIFAAIYSYLLMKHTTFFSWDVVETFSHSFSNTYPAAESGNIFLVTVTTLFLIGIGMKMFKLKI